MFWRKNSKSNESKEIQLIEAHLSVGMRLIQEKLTNSAIKSAVQIFILGMADKLRQAGNLPWEEYVSICQSLFAKHDIVPPNGVEAFIEKVAEIVGTNEEVARIMRYGAQSIEMYVLKNDADAWMDIVSVTVFAKENENEFYGI